MGDGFGVGIDEARHWHRRAYDVPVRIDLQDTSS